jgi:hypothetical protein
MTEYDRVMTFILTNVLILSPLLFVPHAYVEALLGQVRDGARVDKLLVEVGVQGLPLDRRQVLGALFYRMEDPEEER